MKAFLMILSLCATLPLAARTFTSVDGAKKIEADLISYRPDSGTVVLRFEGKSRRSTTKASAFSKKDQKYFLDFFKESTKRESMKVDAKLKSERFKKEGTTYTYSKKKEQFDVTVANRGDFKFEKLVAKYDVYVSKFDKKGKRIVKTVSGEESIYEILGKASAQFVTSSVEITIDCSSSSSCPKCQTTAAAVKRERVIGIRVRVHDGDGEMLSEYFSSNAVRAASEKADEDEEDRKSA